MPTPILVLTTAGVAAAASAQTTGLLVNLTTFTVGDGYNYTPSSGATGLQGSTLYTGTITSAAKQADGSILINCTLPATAGPFQFGECGIYTDGGVLFGVATLPTLESKYSSLSGGVASTFTFGILLNLGTATTTIINISAGATPPTFQYATSWSLVSSQSPSTPTPIYQLVVSQPDNKGDYTTLVMKADGSWTVQSNYFALSNGYTLVGADIAGTFATISMASWLAMVASIPNVTLATAGSFSFVFKSSSGKYRQATVAGASSSAVQLTFDVAFTAGELASGQTFTLYTNAVSFSTASSSSGSGTYVTNAQLTSTLSAYQFTSSNFAGSITPVTMVSATPSAYLTPVIYNLTTGTVLDWNGSSYTNQVAAARISGQVTASQILSVSASQVTGTLAASQISSIAASQITGTLNASQINSVAATQITGTLTAGQIASLTTAQLTGKITTAQITADAVTKMQPLNMSTVLFTGSSLSTFTGSYDPANSLALNTYDGSVRSDITGSIAITAPAGLTAGYYQLDYSVTAFHSLFNGSSWTQVDTLPQYLQWAETRLVYCAPSTTVTLPFSVMVPTNLPSALVTAALAVKPTLVISISGAPVAGGTSPWMASASLTGIVATTQFSV
jgi:hypothetical protein